MYPKETKQFVCHPTMTASDLGHIVTYLVNQKGDRVSPKKLQKLLYYIEAWHLVYFNTPILDEHFEAWVHGPVIPSLYHDLKEHGFNNLQVIADEGESIEAEMQEKIDRLLTKDQLELISSVLNKYASLTSWELEMLTHSEQPWIQARRNLPPHIGCNYRIDRDVMKRFYTSMLG